MKEQGNRFHMHIKGIKKAFHSHIALHPFFLEIQAGTFYGLLGENGAGKSTAINLLTGVYMSDEGVIEVDGESYPFITPAVAKRHQISAMHQELSLCNSLSIRENIFLGNEVLNRFGLIDKPIMRQKTTELLKAVGLPDYDPETAVSRLSLAEKQLVEFAKVLSQKPRFLILDEATAALNHAQVARMFEILREMKKDGLSVLFISHRLAEVYQICDVMTVLKDGQQMATKAIDVFDQNELVSLMTGREVGEFFPPKRDIQKVLSKKVVLEVENLSSDKLSNVNLTLHQGEILGIGGLAGQGQSEVLESLFGLRNCQVNTVRFNGRKLELRSPSHLMKAGFAYIPAERKSEGLLLPHSVRFNLTLANLDPLSGPLGTMKRKKEAAQVREYIDRFSIKTTGMNQLVSALSGGNQQKVIIAKWISYSPQLLLLNEPTRGIDVGTKREIYDLIAALSEEGISTILVSSDTLELINFCDRVIVLYEHTVNAELMGDQLTEENLVHASIMQR